jgi:hypothetical protein
MLNPDQIAEMEKAMLEEHRKDREALDRLKRFIPKNSSPAKDDQVDAEYADVEALRPRQRAIELEANDDLAPHTIIGKVESVMLADTTKRWTVPVMLQLLKGEKFPLAAQKPESTLGLVFAKLHKRGKIRLVRRGGGRTPNVYRGQLPTQEGDSDSGAKSERATHGQPDHVQ